MKLWKKVEVGGTTYSVYLAKEEEFPEGFRGVEGFTDPTNATILICNGISKDRVLDTLLHEMLHAALEASGAQHVFDSNVKGGEAKQMQFEETVVRMLTPCLLRALISAGWRPPSDIGKLALPTRKPRM